MREFLNINELAQKTNIADTTIRRYIQKFPDFFTYKGGSRSRRYEDTAINVLVRIKNLYDGGYETELVDSKLREEFAVIVNGDRVGETTEKAATPTLATGEDIVEIKLALVEQMEFNKLLLERLEQQQRYIDSRLEDRDRKLLESIRNLQEEKQARLETAAQKENERPGFFSRLFGK